jgi:hypothetical protein
MPGAGKRLVDTYLLPAAMRELPPPWHDLTYRRSQALEALAPTEERREQARHVLRACLPDRRQGVHDWDEELRDFYDGRDDHTLDEADAWLTRIMPTTSRVTRERVVQVVGAWADMGIPTVPQPPTEQWVDRVAAEWAASVRQALAYDAFAFIERATTAGLLSDVEAEDAALLTAAFVRVGVAVEAAVRLLVSLGRPRGEQALRELVHDDEVRDFRPYVRSRLLGLRRSAYEVRAREVTSDEEPPLPEGLQGLPYWFLHRTDDVPGSREALARLAFDPSLPVTTRNAAQEWAP